MNWSQFEKYLKPAHLAGRRAVVTIADVKVETLHPRPGVKEPAPVLYFKGREKGLILSATNRRALAGLFGDDSNNAIGKQIELEATPVVVAGKERTPIRIYEHREAQARPPAPAGKVESARVN
jgi:hypothetical protein